MKSIRYTFTAVALVLIVAPTQGLAGELIYGCMTRPACGKMCKLVCEQKTITAVGYGCECADICIPGPSCPGCKHCETVCCCNTPAATKGCPPKIDFCWYDWCSRGCAAPRTVKVLTKFQAERKICWYHWEVVDGCNCGCDPSCGCVYKPAPEDAQLGLAMPILAAEQVELTGWMAADAAKRNATLADAINPPQEPAASPQPAAATAASEKPSITKRISSLFYLGK